MAEAALKLDGPVAPRIIRISSKRQITIPADMYAKSGFSDYAFVSWHEDGRIDIAPIDVTREDESVRILRSLLEQGFDGKELVDEYEKIIRPITDFRCAIDEGLDDIENGRVRPFGQIQDAVKAKHGL